MKVTLNGVDYTLTPLRLMRDGEDSLGPLSDFFNSSNVGECTNYYHLTIFNREEGFICAYSDNLSNNWKI